MWIPGGWSQYIDILWLFQFLCGWLAGGKIGECACRVRGIQKFVSWNMMA